MRLSSPTTHGAAFTLHRGGCPLHVRVEGYAHGPAVVLTHGFTMDHRVFDAQVEALAPHYRVVRWDVPGHGLSRPLASPFTLHAIAQDLLAILDELRIERAVFVGHSMGGLLAQEIELFHPERVLGLAMISSTCLTFRQPRILGVAPLTAVALQLWPDRWTQEQIGWIAGLSPQARAYAADAAAMMSKSDRVAIWKALLDGFHEEPNYRIQCPLLLMEGKWDWVVAAGFIKLLARRWAERDRPWRHVVVPGAGHNAQQDNPSFVNQQLLDFLDHVAANTQVARPTTRPMAASA